MKLPIPFEFGGKRYDEAEIRRPTGGVIADTKRVADQGDFYGAIATFVAGCLESLGKETDRGQLRVLTREMPYPDAEFLSIQSLILAGVADDMEGVYSCPRCHNQIIVDVDDGEKISEIPVNYAEDLVAADVELVDPVILKNQSTDEEIVNVQSLKVKVPTLGQLSRAFKRYGLNDQVRLQFAAYVDATETINGQTIDGHWKSSWGMLVFERMAASQVNAITRVLREYGMATFVERICTQCGKHWDAEVDTAGFFASGLRE